MPTGGLNLNSTMNRRSYNDRKTLRSRLNDDQHASAMGGTRSSLSTMDTSVDPESLTPEDYLDRFGITAYLQEVLSLVLENRPQAPVEFVAEYFRNAVQGSSYLHRAYRLVCMTDRGRPGFLGNVMKAHQILSHRKGSIGVTGEEMTKLLTLICHNFPKKISEIVLKTLFSGQHDPTEIIAFDVFFLSVNVCLLFVEQIEFAQQYFATLCMEDTARGVVMMEGGGSGGGSGGSGGGNDGNGSGRGSIVDDSSVDGGGKKSSGGGGGGAAAAASSDGSVSEREEIAHEGTRPGTLQLEQRASVGSLMSYLRSKKEDEAAGGRSTSRSELIELVALEASLQKLVKRRSMGSMPGGGDGGGGGGVTLEEFCTLLVMQAMPDEEAP